MIADDLDGATPLHAPSGEPKNLVGGSANAGEWGGVFLGVLFKCKKTQQKMFRAPFVFNSPVVNTFCASAI